MTDKERALLEKELVGLEAKLRWDHVGEGIKEVWRTRILEIRIKLQMGLEQTAG